jgi:hypothetical protein
MISNKLIRFFTLLGFLMIILGSCSDRNKDNPFDPQGAQPLSLEITGFSNRISLSWNSPNVTGYSGFNLYRSEFAESSSFELFRSNISPGERSFDDTEIETGQHYYYYMTIFGQGAESKPSAVVSAVPGYGYNWVVDRSGFEILKLTYDLQTPLIRFYTNMRPRDMAVSKNRNKGLILFPSFGEIHQINLESGKIEAVIEGISHPYAIEYDEPDESFWVIDSSGYLYKISDLDLSLQLVSDEFIKPLYLTLGPKNGYLYVTDESAKKIYQLNRDGIIVQTISDVNGTPLNFPEEFIHDEIHNRYWLLENTGSVTYIYTKKVNDSQYSKFEVTGSISDIELSLSGDFVYLSEFDGINSSVLQLYPNGTRQIALTGFYNPLDIAVNQYDNSVIISDTGNGIVWHYDHEAFFIGSFTNLYLPSKVIVE